LIPFAGQSLAEGAADQAAAIEETSSSLEEISSMIQQNAVNASQANTLMKETNQVVGGANATMTRLNKAVAEMDRVTQQNAINAEESANASREMDSQAQQMNGFVGELVSLVDGGSGRKENNDGESERHSGQEGASRRISMAVPEKTITGTEVAIVRGCDTPDGG
jgi:chaperonin GroEL (HSP60 family)